MKRHPPLPTPRPPSAAVEAVYGLRAGLAVVARRPDEVVRVVIGRGVDREAAEDLARWAASRRVPCAELPDAEIEARRGVEPTTRGSAWITRPRRWASPKEARGAARPRGAWPSRSTACATRTTSAAVPPERGVLRRVTGAILGAPAPHPALAPDAVRVAEGGAEHLVLSRTTDLLRTRSAGRCGALGVRVIGADGAARTSALGFAFGRPVVLVLGHEREGMGPRVQAQCDEVVAIPGTSAVESLNVAVAAGVLIAELCRGRPPRA